MTLAYQCGQWQSRCLMMHAPCIESRMIAHMFENYSCLQCVVYLVNSNTAQGS